MPSCPPSADNAFGPAIGQGCRSSFDFTLLFEQTVLTIAPACLLILFAPPRIWHLLRSSTKTLPNPVGLAKAAIATALAALQLAILVLWPSRAGTRASVPSAALSLVASLTILLLSALEHSRSIRPSFLLNVYLLTSLTLDIAQARTLFLRNHDAVPPHPHSTLPGIFVASMAVKLVLLALEARSKHSYLQYPYQSFPPEATSGVLSRSFFWWLNPLFAGGWRKILGLEDLYGIDEDLMAEGLLEKMDGSWAKYQSSGRYALVYACAVALRWPILASFFPRLCLIGFNYAQPLLISRAITFVGQDDGSKNDGYGLIGATGLIYLGIAICTAHYQHRLYRMVTMFRGAVASLIYAKTLKLRAGVYDEAAALTLMSTDIDRIVMSLESLNEIWARIIEIGIGIWLLERQLGWVCVFPVLIVIACVFGAVKVANLIGGRQKEWVAAVQRRVAITSSMLGSMKAVKMMGLSNTLHSIVQNQRVRELELSRRFRVLAVWRNSLSFSPAYFAPLATFVVFAIQSTVRGADQLTTVQAFTSLAIISLVTNPTSELLISLPGVASATGCFDRIQTFLLSESWEDTRNSASTLHGRAMHESGHEQGIELQSLTRAELAHQAIVVEHANVKPSPKSDLALRDVSFEAAKGSLSMIIGVVGSGKSTLLKAVLGELPCESGHIQVASKRMAYCSQTTWLQNASVLQIVCGDSEQVSFDREWYSTVMHACAFDEDVLHMPDGEDTIIGSRGITLSGGQKQRLALARTVYARQDTVLLDDVLSALDASTEELVVDRLLGKTGLFRKMGSTVIFATHAIRHFPISDKIIVLDSQGRISEQGSFEVLQSQDGFVSKVLKDKDFERRNRAADADSSQKGPSAAVKKSVQGPSADKYADLTRRTGDTSVYKYYLASIGWSLSLIIICGTIVSTVLLKFTQIWLNWYSDGKIDNLAIFSVFYVVFVVAGLAASIGAMAVMFLNVIPTSGANLHVALLQTVMRAPQRFFDKTDTGVTLNRFSQDMTLVDSALPGGLILTLVYLANCLAEAALVAVGSTYMALTIPFLLLALYMLQNVYLKTSRQMRFLDLEAKSPLYSHFLETLEGLSTIRSFGWQSRFMRTNMERLNRSQRPYYLLYCIQRWLELVLQLLVGAMAIIVVALATTLRSTSNGGLLGISLNAVLAFHASLQGLITSWTLLETSLGAIARLKTFEANTAPEDKPEENFQPGNDWPSKGGLELRSVSASYGSEAPALRDVSMTIAPGEKVGICGRTGSGKSSLLSTLLRLLDMDSGSITIDGVDLAVVPREVIRSQLVAIPQDPFILSGSVRLNADPSGMLSDEVVVDALTKVQLWDILSARGGLEADMNTQPLSQGQQQLFCLARAMLRNGSKILVLDEATSSVDHETDQIMQRLIREEFKNHTIVTVAHRLDTIMDADKVAVLENGRLVEFDNPKTLLAKPSAFRELQRG